MHNTLVKILQIKLQVWDEKILDPLNYGMGKFDSLSNSCSSETTLDNFWLFTEIFVYINNPLRM